MKVGDLARTHNGNTVLIVEVGSDWCNILFTTTGYLRTGFPTMWLRRLICKQVIWLSTEVESTESSWRLTTAEHKYIAYGLMERLHGA